MKDQHITTREQPLLSTARKKPEQQWGPSTENKHKFMFLKSAFKTYILINPLNKVGMWVGFIILQLKVIAPWLPRKEVKATGETGPVLYGTSRISRWMIINLLSSPSHLREKYNLCSNNWVKPLACCSVTQLCPTLCDPMDCSTPGFPVLYHIPELAQTQVHWVGDAI